MIDVHCHLEQKEFENDLDKVIQDCKKSGLEALVTSCANPADLEKTLKIASMYPDFIFPCLGLHPEYIKELKEKEVSDYLEKIKESRNRIVAIGEIGLDFFWVKEPGWQEKQKEQFAELIRFSKEIKKPLVVHSRDAHPETIRILEQEDARHVLLHMFGGKGLLKSVIENKWLVSINYLITRSKTYKKIARDLPLENICLETDAPWNGQQKTREQLAASDIIFRENADSNTILLRNDPTTIKATAEKIAEIKKLAFGDVWKTCGENAKRFFSMQF